MKPHKKKEEDDEETEIWESISHFALKHHYPLNFRTIPSLCQSLHGALLISISRRRLSGVWMQNPLSSALGLPSAGRPKWNHLFLPSVLYLLIIPGPTLCLSSSLSLSLKYLTFFLFSALFFLALRLWKSRVVTSPQSFQHLNKDGDCIMSGVINQAWLILSDFTRRRSLLH